MAMPFKPMLLQCCCIEMYFYRSLFLLLMPFLNDGLHLNERGKRRLGQVYARVSGLDVGQSAGSKK
jgi:hypothetical protein